MTKLKNTKKGMAKKALSVSLVAAMLATSNVPVWAAEDLFSDGSSDVAVEAPVAEEPAAEVEAFSSELAEEVNDAVQVQAAETGTGYDVTVGDFTYDGGKAVTNNSVTWGNYNIEVPVTVAPAEGGNTNSVYAVWKLNGNAIGTASKYQDVVNNGGKCATSLNDASYAGQKLSLYVYATTGGENDTVVWSYTSDEITISAIDINNSPSAKNIKFASSFDPTYNGKEQTPSMSDVDFTGAGSWDAEDFTMGNAIGDTVNVTSDGVYVLLTVNKQGYTGSLKLSYQIDPVVINSTNVNDYFTAEYTTTSKAYTGKDIQLTNTDVKLTDKKSDKDVTSVYVQKDTALMNIAAADAQAGKEYSGLTFPLKAVDVTEKQNYVISEDVTIAPTNKFSITQRDLSTVNVTIPEQRHINGTIIINPADPKSGVKFTEKDTNKELDLGKDIAQISIVSSVGSHTVTITPATNNKNVTGSTTATVRIADTQLTGATFENDAYATQPEEYTGERIEKDITKLGSVMLNGKPIDSSNYDIQFGTNIDAGTNKGVIRIIGKNSYTGSEAEVYFNINPAKVTADTITYNKFVEKKDTTNPEDYKEAIGLVVKAKNANGKEFTLTDGTDYVASYEFNDNKNEVGQRVVVTLKTNANKLLKNTNFIVDGSINIQSEITQTTLKDENIQLKQTSYVYTGAAIEPKFDIVVDGAIISPNEYKIKTLLKNIDVGTATLVVTGTGKDFSDKVDAEATFTITPANAEDVTAVIPGQEYTGYSIHPKVETVDLNGVAVNVDDNFTVTYGENVEIGEGTITLTPKNDNFTGTKTLTFKIVGQLINGGNLSFYDENGRVVTLGHKYDGTAYEVAKTVFDSSTTVGLDGNTLTEGTDYEIKFVDNVYGKEVDGVQKGAVLVIAKGQYAGNYTSGDFVKDGIYTDAEGNKIGSVIYGVQFTITQQDVARSNVSVSNGTYAGGLAVRPVVEINVMGKTLVEGTDYELDLDGNTDMVNATADKTLTVTVEFKNGYKANSDSFTFDWGIDKFDFANAEVTVDGNDVTVKCGRVDVPTSEYTVTRDAAADTVTITAVEDSKNYTGTKTVSVVVEDPAEAPEAPMIQAVNVNGNNATVVLSGESDGATGYDYVISTDRDCITTKDYDKVNKNILNTETTFTYTQQGVYYAYCHAWKRVDGEKVFSEWSNAYPFVVSAITPEQPVITSVKKSGRNLTVTWTQSENATTGCDIVMGTAMRKVNGEMRPVEYGKAVKKVGPNTFSVTFRSIPKGTYYVGLHAHNRTSESGVKVFSPWSNAKKVTF